MGPREHDSKKRTRLPSLLKKPIIDVRGKIGKAQKSKKRKIKKIFASTVDFYEDPVEDRDNATRSEQSRIDSTPKSLEQEVPRKVAELMRMKKTLSQSGKHKQNSRRKKIIREQKEKDGDDQFRESLLETPNFERQPGESDRAYYTRVEVESNEFVQMAKFENDNECKLVRNDKGQIEIMRKSNRKQAKNKQYREKKKLKRDEKRQKEGNKDFSDLRGSLDNDISFNERTDRPPEVLAKPRKAKEKTNMKERLSSLKFTGLIGNEEFTSSQNKNMSLKSLVAKERLQEERQRAIDMYRSLKAKRRKG